ncbi:UBX domain-containing protein 11 [Aulostomus maculatus]
MSSPLSMLKKTKRRPLLGPQGKQKAPFRRNLSSDVQADFPADDSSNSSRPPASPTLPSDAASTSKSKVQTREGAVPSDSVLMSAMMQRLTLLEKKTRIQEQEIKRKDKLISLLEEKLRDQEESESAGHESRRRDLERRCQQLQDQVNEMESFLNDYGLVWVGDGEAGDPAECEDTRGGDLNFHMNFDLVLQRIRELNILAGEGESFIRSTATGAQLARKEPVKLQLYSNGIVMFDGPFRSYEEPSTQQCIQDLMDGYFPSELQERFPDGVPFEVHDKRDAEFIFRLPWDRFPGEGKAVRDWKKESASSQPPGLSRKHLFLLKTVHATKSKHSMNLFLLAAGRKLSTEKFLNRLPKMVVKAGHVIDIRDSVRATLQGSSDAHRRNSLITIDTPAQRAAESVQAVTSDHPSPARNVITLKVRSEDGSQTYILRMWLSDTIGHLRQHLDAHRGKEPPGYDIISAYPRCRYDDDSQTLQSCGLRTNAALLLRKRQQ